MESIEVQAVTEQLATQVAWLEGVFFAAVFAIAAITGVARIVRDSEYSDFVRCVGLGVCSGSLGFCVVALMLGPGHGPLRFDWFYLGVSALVGLGGKEGDRIVRYLLSKVFKILGIEDEDDIEDKEES